jgi:hypothetical protein
VIGLDKVPGKRLVDTCTGQDRPLSIIALSHMWIFWPASRLTEHQPTDWPWIQ